MRLKGIPEQHDQAYPDEYAAFGLGQVGVYKLEDDFRGFVVPPEPHPDLVLHQIGEAEPARYGKQDGKYGDYGKQRAIGQCGSLVGQSVLGEAGDAQVDGLDYVVEGKCGLGDFILRDTPDVVCQKLPEGGDAFIHN